MKSIISLVVAATLSYCSISALDADTNAPEGKAVSVLEMTTVSTTASQEDAVAPATPTLQEPPSPVPVPQEPVQAPVPQDIVAPTPIETYQAPPVMVDESMYQMPMANDCCPSCCVNPCCCPPPPPSNQTFCLVDPCGCSYEACICVPACCAGQQPCVTWKKGLFRRQIATLCWNCCGHEVKVLITGHGKVRVKG